MEVQELKNLRKMLKKLSRSAAAELLCHPLEEDDQKAISSVHDLVDALIEFHETHEDK